MTTSTEETARLFWATARLPEGYPRDIEQAVVLVLPVAIVKLSVLSMPELKHWLAGNGVGAETPTYEADLLGCLVANRGHGILFVCAGDTPDEQRLTVAHESAHFMRHYLAPRKHVVEALGPDITAVLDGDREAAADERVAGVLAGVRVGAHVHLVPRSYAANGVVGRAETEADDLALELLAPRVEVSAFLRTRHVDRASAAEQQRALGAHFGVPVHAFDRIVADLRRGRPTPFLADALATVKERLP